MVPPRVVVEDGMGGRRLARAFSRSAAAERLVNAIFIVITSVLARSVVFLTPATIEPVLSQAPYLETAWSLSLNMSFGLS